jgi:CO/xanthine dehydrogenase FAD-binding subunit
MDAPHNQVFFPESAQELFSAWARFPDAVPFAGGTGLFRSRNTFSGALPSNILSLDHLEELHRISRTERYIEAGAMVKLNEIMHLGKIVPDVLTQALRNIAGPQVRNLATIGGHICHPSQRLDASAPLIALDARYELRTASQTRWVAAARFSSPSGPLPINPQELLTRIRIPLEQWNYSIYKKFTDGPFDGEPGGETADDTPAGGALVFLARIQKNILTDIRVVCTGDAILRDKNSEALLSGKRLPLDRRVAMNFVEHWKICFSGLKNPGPMMRDRMLNSIESCTLLLAD